jgi:hypothetical protein
MPFTIRTRIWRRLTFVALVSACAAASQEVAPKREVSGPPPAARPSAAAVKQAGAPLSSSPLAEVVAKNFSVDGGHFVDWIAGTDFTGADRASIGVSAGDTGSDLSQVRVLVFWLIPGADWYVVTDVIRGDSFPFSTLGGGANVAVYGTKLLLRIINDGTQSVTIAHLGVYGNAR